MKLAHIAPRNMRFSVDSATSIDLCIRDFVQYSAYGQQSLVIGGPVETPFPDINFQPTSQAKPQIGEIAGILKKFEPDIILCHQHLPSAARLARRFPSIPVILHRHNYLKGPRNFWHKIRRYHQFSRLSGIFFCSDACSRAFEHDWQASVLPLPFNTLLFRPLCGTILTSDIKNKDITSVQQKSLAGDFGPIIATILNSLDFSQWRPVDEKQRAGDKFILFAGRMDPQKGALETADALATFLPRYRDWRSIFIAPDFGQFPGYAAKVRTALQPVSGQVTLLGQTAHSQVQKLMERASIVIVPSKGQEAFGRVALEAHAGAASLIAADHSGLSEVAGPHALSLNSGCGPEIDRHLSALATCYQSCRDKGLAGRRWAETRFRIEESAARLDVLCDHLVKHSRKKR